MAAIGADPWGHRADRVNKPKHKPKLKVKTNRHGYPSIECSPEQREKDEKRIREMMSQWWG